MGVAHVQVLREMMGAAGGGSYKTKEKEPSLIFNHELTREQKAQIIEMKESKCRKSARTMLQDAQKNKIMPPEHEPARSRDEPCGTDTTRSGRTGRTG